MELKDKNGVVGNLGLENGVGIGLDWRWRVGTGFGGQSEAENGFQLIYGWYFYSQQLRSRQGRCT